MDIVIRKGVREDFSSILELVVELAVYEEEPDAVTATLEDYLKGYDDGLLSAHVAEHEGKVIGMTLYYMTFSTWKGHMLYLEDFYVEEAYRSHGVGQMLFDAFIKEAKERKCKMVKWQVIDWNEKAVKFYEKNGATIEKNWWNSKIIFD